MFILVAQFRRSDYNDRIGEYEEFVSCKIMGAFSTKEKLEEAKVNARKKITYKTGSLVLDSFAGGYDFKYFDDWIEEEVKLDEVELLEGDE